jgi:acetyl-CoA carboxylase carboxyltransferase component
MGGDQATSTLLDVTIASMRRQRQTVDEAEMTALRDKVKGDYDRQMDIRYGAARGWVDAIIDPAETRPMLIESLCIATRHVDQQPFRLGVFQV